MQTTTSRKPSRAGLQLLAELGWPDAPEAARRLESLRQLGVIRTRRERGVDPPTVAQNVARVHGYETFRAARPRTEPQAPEKAALAMWAAGFPLEERGLHRCLERVLPNAAAFASAASTLDVAGRRRVERARRTERDPLVAALRRRGTRRRDRSEPGVEEQAADALTVAYNGGSGDLDDLHRLFPGLHRQSLAPVPVGEILADGRQLGASIPAADLRRALAELYLCLAALRVGPVPLPLVADELVRSDPFRVAVLAPLFLALRAALSGEVDETPLLAAAARVVEQAGVAIRHSRRADTVDPRCVRLALPGYAGEIGWPGGSYET